MKLKRSNERGTSGYWRIGHTDWYLIPPHPEAEIKMWDIGYWDGKQMNVGIMFSTRREALDYFKRSGYWPDWGPRRSS